MSDPGFRLRQLHSNALHWFPGARVDLRRNPVTGDHELRVRISDHELVDPEPIGLVERDRDRLIDEARD